EPGHQGGLAMMSRTVADARGWMQHGTALFMSQTDLGDRALDEASALPGWSRRHLLAHVAANADALGNLVRWAATGEPTPMYASPTRRSAPPAARAAALKRARRPPARALRPWLPRSPAALKGAMPRLSGQQWQAPVLTAQGRSVPATEVLWMRSREVYVHAVDL